MATLNDTTADFPDVYQLEQTDPVLGGEPNEGTGAGMDNIPHLHLAKRTRWLKTKVDLLLTTAGQLASTAVAGIVQLSDSVTSTAVDRAATANAVRVANENANGRVPTSREVKGGGLVSGGGALTATRTLTVTAASSADATEGTRVDVAMTPASTKAVLDQRLAGGSLGIGQAWQDVSGARNAGTTYQNTTAQPIMVAISAGGSGDVQVSADSVTWVTLAQLDYPDAVIGWDSGLKDHWKTISFVVPPSHFYRQTGGSKGLWAELR